MRLRGSQLSMAARPRRQGPGEGRTTKSTALFRLKATNPARTNPGGALHDGLGLGVDACRLSSPQPRPPSRSARARRADDRSAARQKKSCAEAQLERLRAKALTTSRPRADGPKLRDLPATRLGCAAAHREHRREHSDTQERQRCRLGGRRNCCVPGTRTSVMKFWDCGSSLLLSRTTMEVGEKYARIGKPRLGLVVSSELITAPWHRHLEVGRRTEYGRRVVILDFPDRDLERGGSNVGGKCSRPNRQPR